MGGHLNNSYLAKEKFIMKLFSLALVAGVTIAQKKKPNYPGSRPVNKPVKKPGNKPYKKPTPPPPPPPIYSGTGGGANAAQNQGSPYADAYGDPHFMVATLGQEPICFDYNPPAGSEMTLIMDPDSGLHISAKVDGRRQGKTRFMTNVHIDDYKVEAVWETFHRNTQCWTIEEDDLIPLF